jgi:hypothetical protein
MPVFPSDTPDGTNEGMVKWVFETGLKREDVAGVGHYAPRNTRPQQATKDGLRQTDVAKMN